MFQYPEDVPVLFLIYNRPQLTSRVFSKIREAKVKHLFINADGPNSDKSGDKEKVEETRKIVEQVDWECNLYYNYHEINKGCKDSVNSGLDWFFSKNEGGIILEDDCLPDLSFFEYCKELLNKYQDDDRIMHISGTNLQTSWDRYEYSYYFSKYASIWGWASWRRAWEKHDKEIRNWPDIRDKRYFYDMFDTVNEALRRRQRFDQVYYNQVDTWDYQWEFTILTNNGLGIVPRVNLVSNIGFGVDAAHGNRKRKKGNLPLQSLKFPLNVPPFIIRDQLLERQDVKHKLQQGPLWYFKNFMEIVKTKLRYL